MLSQFAPIVSELILEHLGRVSPVEKAPCGYLVNRPFPFQFTHEIMSPVKQTVGKLHYKITHTNLTLSSFRSGSCTRVERQGRHLRCTIFVLCIYAYIADVVNFSAYR